MKTVMQITVVLAAITVVAGCSKNLPDGNGPSGGGTEIIDEPLEDLPPLEDVDDVCEKMTDIGFMSYCYLNFDANMDGRVSMTEANAVKAIECDDAENFSGIEYFSNLETFKSSSVQTIDLRYNKKLLSVDCKGAPIAVIDLRYNTGLQEMSFEDCTNFVKVLLPSSLDYIGRSTFRNTAIVRFVCPDSVKTIEDSAFAGCSSLKSVTFPDDIVMYLGEGAFRDCISLGAVTLPKSYGLDAEMFAGCNSLKSITWPKEVPNNYNSDNSISYVVGEDAFKGCKSLESVTFPDDYQIFITSGTFAGCSSLKSVISFPHLGVPEAAFEGCVSLESITCKYGYVSFVEDFAFSGCSSLKTITFSDGLTEVGDYAFYGCSSLKTIMFSDDLTEVGDYAFYGCSSLKTIMFSDDLTEVGDYAFYGCSSLKTIMFSDDLTEIGTCAFYNCSLKKVVCYALDPPYLRNENGDPFDRYCKIPELYVPSSSVDAYNQSSWSLYFEQILPIE